MWKTESSVPLRTNHLLILNLAVADLLMGIYLIILGITGLVFSGRYCAVDISWRSGVTCQIMGVLIALSSETSVMTMLLLASFRLFAVLKVVLSPNTNMNTKSVIRITKT